MKWIFTTDFKPHFALQICLLVAVALAAAMAIKSQFDAHPDEVHHFAAANYYTTHFLPPKFDDPTIRSSYSVYGVSYLNYHWFEYLAAGKFAFVADYFFANPVLSARFFNIFLLLTLAVFFIYRSRNEPEIFILGAFLLISPQIWYVFSYVNNDAIALFLCFLAAYQIARPTSLFNRFLTAETFFGKIGGGLWFGLLVGLLLTAKTNYYTFLLFAGLWLLFRAPVYNFRKFDFKRLQKYGFIVLFAVSILLARCAADFYVNGETNFVGLSYLNYSSGNFERQNSRLLQVQEEYAEPRYKPSAFENNLANTEPSMKLKAKGETYFSLFSRWRWHESSFRSFVGLYGYFKVYSNTFYYRLMFFLYVIFGIYVLGAIVRTRDFDALIETGIFLLAASLTIFISTYLSWTYAVQAQGRYLFPIIPMLGLLIYSNRKKFASAWLNFLFGAMFLASVYSFVRIGLRDINTPFG